MRFFIIFTVFVCLAFPVFSQNANQRFNALSESMGATVSRTTENLADYDSRMKDNADYKVYGSYRIKYEYYVKALQDSEYLLNQMLRSNDRVDYLKKERDHYESLLKQLEATKSEYDNFVRSVR